MFQTMLIGSALATSLFVLFRCWRRRRDPWMGTAASACVVAAVFWMATFFLGAISFGVKTNKSEWVAALLGCSVLLTLASCITAFVLGLISEFAQQRESSATELGLSPATNSE